MATPNFSEFTEQAAQYFAKFREMASPEDQAKFDACAEVMNKIEQNRKKAPNQEIEIKIIDQIIGQHVKEACSNVEAKIVQQAEIIGNCLSQLFQHHGIGVCSFINEKYEDIRIHFDRLESIVTGHEVFQKQILDQVEELRIELRNEHSDQPPMDLSKDDNPSPDQDSNGCLDGDLSLNNDQKSILKEIKETANQPANTKSSILQHKANQGDMNKSSNRKRKPAPNAEQVPGSPESSKMKNRDEIRDNIPHINLEKNEFWADPQIKKSTVPTIINDPKTGRELVNIEEHEFEATDDYNYQPSRSAKKRMRKRRITDAKRAKSEVVIYGLEETIYEDDNELYWLSEAKKFIKFTEELSPDYLGEKDGIELTLDDIDVTNRILVWTGKHDENNPLPMVVQLKDEEVNTKKTVIKRLIKRKG